MVIAIVITFVSSFYDKDSTVDRLSIKISNILQILLFAGILISYDQYENNNKQVILTQQSILTEKGWVQVYEKIEEYYDKCPNFCNSLSYNWQIPKKYLNMKKKTNLNKDDDYGAILSLSILIFQSFQNVLNYFLYYNSDEKIDDWLKSFIIWANSNILYDTWQNNKFIYDISIQIYIDKIFKEVRDKPPKNQKEIEKLARKICRSDEMKNIFKIVGKKSPCE